MFNPEKHVCLVHEFHSVKLSTHRYSSNLLLNEVRGQNVKHAKNIFVIFFPLKSALKLIESEVCKNVSFYCGYKCVVLFGLLVALLSY